MLQLTVDCMKEDNVPLTYNKTLLALQIIIDPENHPIYIHCLDGADVTGLVIACLRKLQMWSLSSTIVEFSRNLHTSVVSSEEFEFVENFKNFEVTIPLTIPKWLWGGKVDFRKHPNLRLKFLNPEMMTNEEREQKDKQERKEKDKEDYYKKRKNDLLDNLFDASSSPTSRHNRPTSVYGSMQESNSNTPTSNSSSKGQLTSNSRLSTLSHGNPISSNATNIINNNNNNNNNNNSNTSSSASKEFNEMDYTPTKKVIVERIDNDDDDDDDDEREDDNRKSRGRGRGRSRRHSHENDDDDDDDGKDQYLIDVDIDIDGVMMDGLDQVQYYKRSAAGFFSDDEGDQVDDVIIDDQGNIYDDGVGTRYTTEPLSRMLDALALEGLD
ncbi:unnamed protein product [Cunninghamella echinulata]